MIFILEIKNLIFNIFNYFMIFFNYKISFLNALIYFPAGVKINSKIAVSLFLMIFILSISAVSAEALDNGNLLNPDVNYLNSNSDDNINNLEINIENTGGDSLEDSFSDSSSNDKVSSDVLSDESNLEESNLEESNLDEYDSNSLDSQYPCFENDESDNYLSNMANLDYLNQDDADSEGDDDDDSGDDSGADDDDDDGNESDENKTLNTTLRILSLNNWKIYGGENYTVKLYDEEDNPVAGALIKFKIQTPSGSYLDKTSFTDENGIAVLNLNFNSKGVYTIQVSYDGDSNYNPAQLVVSNVILYEKTIIKTPKKYAFRSSNFTIKLVSSDGKILSKKVVLVYVNGVKYTRTTNSKGEIYVKMPSKKSSVNITCIFYSCDYYESSELIMKLPVYKRTCIKPLTYSILKGRCFKVLLKGKDGKILKKEKVKFTINGKTYIRTTNKKGIAYIRIKLKRNEYKIKFSFGHNSVYGPSSNSSTLNVIDPSGQFKKGLNQNTKRSVKKYLSGGGHAAITKSIRRLSKKITRKYSTKLEKATAIFNYVRNNLGYSYYANSRKGAAKTLRTKMGNCCDHANLIVALCRASKIPARYSHAQGCRFRRSGMVEGHVWAQIYVNGRWYSADGTSYSNSLGHISNWDTKHYYKFHSYRSIPF